MKGGLLLRAASPCGYMPRVARRLAALADPAAARVDIAFADMRSYRRAKCRQGQSGCAGDRDIAGEAADRVAAEQRVGAEMDHLAIGRRRLAARQPRHVAFEDDD